MLRSANSENESEGFWAISKVFGDDENEPFFTLSDFMKVLMSIEKVARQ